MPNEGCKLLIDRAILLAALKGCDDWLNRDVLGWLQLCYRVALLENPEMLLDRGPSAFHGSWRQEVPHVKVVGKRAQEVLRLLLREIGGQVYRRLLVEFG